jgi:predicted aminopeptidase
MDWALSIAQGQQKWNDTRAAVWDGEVERFFTAMKRFDDFLASDTRLQADPEKLFQGPMADALTHVGQLSMLRRLAGSPVRGENYLTAEIQSGRVGPRQSSPKQEFS